MDIRSFETEDFFFTATGTLKEYFFLTFGKNVPFMITWDGKIAIAVMPVW